MPKGVYSYLSFAKFKDFENWSVSHILGMNMGYNERYLLVSIGQLISNCIKPMEIEDNTSYKQITLRTNGGGVVWRDDVDSNRILPEYLALFSTTTSFVKFAKSCSRGTTNRQRIDVNLFLSQRIPLPTLEEQYALVASHKNKIEQSERLDGQAAQIERSVEHYLSSTLGITKKGNIVPEPPTAKASEPQIEYVVSNQQLEDHADTRHRVDESKKEYMYLRFARFKNIEKWGIDYTVGKTPDITITEYPLKRISELCKIGSGGTPARGHKEYYNGSIPWIKTGELHDEILYDTEEKITQQGLENSSAKLYPKGSLVVAMYGATIGKTAKLGVDATTNQACAVLSYIDQNLIQTDYLWIYLQSQANTLKQMAYGGAQPNINASIISNYLIPIPPIDLQNSIVAHINKLKKRIKLLKRLADNLRKGALDEFEKVIFEY